MAHDDLAGEAYRFGDFRLEADRRALSAHDEPVPLPPKVFDVLLALVRGYGALVDKQSLLDAVWPGTDVDENNLNQAIASLRRALQDRRGLNRYIETVQGRGYRFVAPVERIAAPLATAGQRARIAVLPFANLTGDPGRDYIADGLTEETIAALGQVDPERIGVPSRATMMAYKGMGASRAGRELGADYTVEGSLRTEESRFRVSATLARALDGVQVWNASFDSEPTSMLDFQRELAGALARQIRVRLAPGRVAAMAYRQPAVPDALDSYLRGRHCWHQLTPATTRQALDCYARATSLDADYALAWCGIADALSTRPITGDIDPREVSASAHAAAERALRARPELAESQASVGFCAFWLDADWPEAERRARRAIELDPSYALSHRLLGIACMHLGRHDASRPAMRMLRELEPLLPVNHALSAQSAFAARDYPAAVRFARQALVLDPDFWIAHLHLAQASIELGDVETAWGSLAEGAIASGGNSKIGALRGWLLAREGRVSEARTVLDAFSSLASERFLPPCAFALVHLGLGEMDAVAYWLARAVEVRDVHLMFVPIDPKWDEARADPRVKAVLRDAAFAVS
jgi:DNA-binding winged helix-turn-helix (wHTH) protein/Flp pilus assembly protein TadD